MNSINKLAAHAVSLFKWQDRINGKGFWSVQGDIRGEDEWVVDMCRDAHSGMLPDDHKYEFIRDALSDIAELDDDATEDDAQELEVEADIYTHDLLLWLASSNTRAEFCDSAQDAYAIPANTSMVERISLGQAYERREVLISVIDSLMHRAQSDE